MTNFSLSQFTAISTRIAIAAALAITILQTILTSAVDTQNDGTKVVLDPTLDAFIASGHRNSSYTTSSSIWIGQDVSDGQFGVQHAIVQFKLQEDLPESIQMNDANLILHLSAYTNGDPPLDLVAKRILDPLPQIITWDTYKQLSLDEGTASPARSVNSGSDFDNQPFEFDVLSLMAAWLSTEDRPESLAIVIMPAVEPTSQRERAFWSSDCPTNRPDDPCQEAWRPQLSIDYSVLEPTPTTIPSPTVTPTSGIKAIRLNSQPSGVIAPESDVTYTISFTNGIAPVSNVVVSNPVPCDLALINGGITGVAGWSATPNPNDRTILWRRNTLDADQTVQLSYTARRGQSPGGTVNVPQKEIVLSACTATPTATPTETSPPTETPTVTPTETLTPTATNSPTATATATATVATTATITSTVVATPATETPTSTVTAPTATPLPVETTATPSSTPSTIPSVTPLPQDASLQITKRGAPEAVGHGEEIRYTLTITNLSDGPLQGLIVVDYVPLGTSIEDYGGGARLGVVAASAENGGRTQTIRWPPFDLDAGQSTTRSFSVRVLDSFPVEGGEIVNDLYFVEVNEGLVRARGEVAVVTTVRPRESVVTSNDRKPDPIATMAPTPSIIINEGAIISWEHSDPNFSGELHSNSVMNPPTIYIPHAIRSDESDE